MCHVHLDAYMYGAVEIVPYTFSVFLVEISANSTFVPFGHEKLSKTLTSVIIFGRVLLNRLFILTKIHKKVNRNI